MKLESVLTVDPMYPTGREYGKGLRREGRRAKTEKGSDFRGKDVKGRAGCRPRRLRIWTQADRDRLETVAALFVSCAERGRAGGRGVGGGRV